MARKKWTPLCEICHAAPKMDRCDVCEECWYNPPAVHSRDCENQAFLYHAATGGDLPCICGAQSNR